MEKYILGKNIIITTKERYEKTFKDLGYIPYHKPSIENKEFTKKEDIRPVGKRKNKEEEN